MQKVKQSQKKSAFLVKTYEILESKKYQNIVAWHHDGIGFIITDIDQFTSTVLPIYFKHSNFASYIRQLNMYGFSKKRSAKSQNYYHHPKFQKNEKDLIREIQRKTEKKQVKAKNKDGPEDVKISSELSIQLESQYRSSRKIEHPDSTERRSIESKFNQLCSTNETLINVQFSTLLSIFGDLSVLGSINVSEQDRESFRNSLTEYIQTQCQFFNHLKEKYKAESKNFKSLALLETEQTLREKKEQEKGANSGQLGCHDDEKENGSTNQ